MGKGKGKGKTDKGKKAGKDPAAPWGKRKPGEGRYDKNRLRGFMHNIKSLTQELGNSRPEDIAKLQKQLEDLEQKRSKLQRADNLKMWSEGDCIRGAKPDSIVHAKVAADRRSSSRRSRSPARRRSSSSSWAPAATPKRAARSTAASKAVQKRMKGCGNKSSSSSSSSVSSTEVDPAARTHKKRTTLTEAPQQQAIPVHSPPQAASRQRNAKIDAERAKHKDLVQSKREAQSEETLGTAVAEMISEVRRADGKTAAAASAEKKRPFVPTNNASGQQNAKGDVKRAKKELVQPKREAKSEKTRFEPIAKQIAPAAAAKKIAAPASAEKIPEAASAEKIAAARLADLRVYLLAGQVALGRAAGIPLAPGWKAKSTAKLAALQPSFMKPMPRGVPRGEVTQLGEGWLASIRATGIYEDDLTAKRWMICLKRPEKGLEETCDGKVRAFYRYDVDLESTHHIKTNLRNYARAVASSQRGLQSGGIGNRHCPLICYTSLLPPPLTCNDFFLGEQMQFRLVQFVFHKKRSFM